MKTKLPAFRHVPVDFGNGEPLCAVPIHELRFPARCPRRSRASGATRHPSRFNASTLQRFNDSGFTLVEILVVLVLLSMIVLALMAVFSGIQRAFRASLTQTDTLEGGRAVMDLIANDLQTMTPSYGISNILLNRQIPGFKGPGVQIFCPINFSATLAPNFVSPPSPLFQPLLSSPSGAFRSNYLENIFILSKGNVNGVPAWIGTGYSVNTNLADGTLYPLYRFYQTTNIASGPPGIWGLYYQFSQLNYTNSAQWSHLMDGVVNLTARAYDTNGVSITNGYINPNWPYYDVQNVFTFGSPYVGVSQFYFCSNSLPDSVEIELGTMEDRTLVHAESLGGANQSNYLSNAAGQVHLFRQRVWIPNVDLSAYQ